MKITNRRAMLNASVLLTIVAAAIMVSCRSNSMMTGKLFMQTQRANLELPYKSDSTDGAIVSENVTFKGASNIDLATGEVAFKEGQNKLDTGAVYRLGEVEVKAKSRFAPERDGRISVDFKVVVPKEVLSENWRVTMSPILLHNDSVIPLQKLVINGQGFIDKQEQDYANYEEYLNSIVDKSKYDSVYLNHEKVQSDIRSRQGYYLKTYKKEWKKQVSFEKWRFMRNNINSYYTAKEVAYKKIKYHKYARKEMEERRRYLVDGKDTTGLYAKYKQEYERMTDIYPDEWSRTELVTKKVPKKYRNIFETNRVMGDIPNHVLTVADSIEISQHRYDYDKIVMNEVAAIRKDEIFDELVKFPYNENKAELRVDTILTPDKNFVFYYEQEYPVVAGLKNVRITMNSRVEAIDESEFMLPKADTLSFFISSLAQLVDTSLVYKRTKLHRNMFDRLTVYTEYRNNKNSNYDISYGRNRENMAKFLEAFRTYNGKPEFSVDSVTMVSTTSLDGDYEENSELTLNRANSVKDYLASELGGEANVDYIFRVNHRGEDWNTLVAQIRRRDEIMNKDAILDILTNAVYPDQTELDIKKQFPGDYKVIQDSIYPLLRRIDFIVDIHRPALQEAIEEQVEYRADYEEGLRLLQDREYWKAIDILANYPDYNTALCLVCMGYNEKADNLLVQLAPTGNTEYLRAIVAIRMNREDDAVQHLITACQIDPSKVYRVTLDPEVNALVQKFGLQDQLEDSEFGDAPSQMSMPTTSTPDDAVAEDDVVAEDDANTDNVDSEDVPTEDTSVEDVPAEETPIEEDTVVEEEAPAEEETGGEEAE